MKTGFVNLYNELFINEARVSDKHCWHPSCFFLNDSVCNNESDMFFCWQDVGSTLHSDSCYSYGMYLRLGVYHHKSEYLSNNVFSVLYYKLNPCCLRASSHNVPWPCCWLSIKSGFFLGPLLIDIDHCETGNTTQELQFSRLSVM